MIRKIKVEDAKELAHNIALVWNNAYKGIIDKDFLDSLYKKEDEIVKNIEKQASLDLEYYVLEVDKKIVGWMSYSFDSDKLDEAAEVNSLYVTCDYQGMGYGKELLNYAFKNIKKKGIDKVVIGCLDKNISNDFYIHMGGKFLKTQMFREKYLENIYLFEL